jgi:ubiquinone/menaquinone biosynthesis C-methylase UbiE
VFVSFLLNFAVNTLAAGLGAATGLQASLRASQNLRPYPLPRQFTGLLELPLRRQYMDPGEVLGMYGVNAGMEVLDAGCGTGIFTVEMARMLGSQGRVHAVDLQPAMIEHTRARVNGAGVGHLVQLHQVGLYDLPFADDSLDLAVLISTLGEIPDKPAALSELRRVLKPGARLGVTDELLFTTHLLSGSTRRWSEEAGFRLLAKSGSPLCYHMVFANEK